MTDYRDNVQSVPMRQAQSNGYDPLYFMEAMRKTFLSLDMVCLTVFDDSHRTTGKHAYAKILKEFYHRSANKQKLFRIAAAPKESLLVHKVQSQVSLETLMKRLKH